MKTQFELNEPVKIDLHAYGINTDPVELPPGYILPRQAVVPFLSVRNYFNDPVVKQVLVHFFECRFPILLVDREEYTEKYYEINNQYIENKIAELIERDAPGFVVKGVLARLACKKSRELHG